MNSALWEERLPSSSNGPGGTGVNPGNFLLAKPNGSVSRPQDAKLLGICNSRDQQTYNSDVQGHSVLDTAVLCRSCGWGM